jgi:hypothetical protein
MGRYGNIDYPTVTKRAFFVGVALFILGFIGEAAGQAYFGPLPGWEETLLLTFETLGIFIALLAPLVFGIVLPLTE